MAGVAICMLAINLGEYQSWWTQHWQRPNVICNLLGLGEMGLGQPKWLRGGVGRHHHGALRTTFTPEGNSAWPNLSLLPSLPSDQLWECPITATWQPHVCGHMYHTLGCEEWVASQNWHVNAPTCKLNVIGCTACTQRLHVVMHMWG